jgi:RHS repeat-associated protein
VYLVISDGTNKRVKDTGVGADYGWTHFAAKSNRFYVWVYVNGSLVGTLDIANMGNVNGSQSMFFGKGNNGSYYGKIDEVGIWNRALNDDEISDLYRYGRDFDDGLRDVDFHFRKYQPEWAIFTQPDSLLPNVYDPQSLNRYSFERNNPYGYTDESGHEPFTFGAAGIGVILTVLGGTIYVKESVEFMGKIWRGEATKRDWVYFEVNSVLVSITGGIGKAGSAATVAIFEFDFTDWLTDAIMEVLEIKEEDEKKDHILSKMKPPEPTEPPNSQKKVESSISSDETGNSRQSTQGRHQSHQNSAESVGTSWWAFFLNLWNRILDYRNNYGESDDDKK